MEFGFKVTAPSTCSDPKALLDKWVAEAKRFYLDIELLTVGDSPILLGTSSIMTCSTAENETFDEKKLMFYRLSPTTLYVSKVVVVQVDVSYTNTNIKVRLCLGISQVQSRTPSIARRDMGSEEQAIRTFLETGRYCPPHARPREVVAAARIINAVSMMPWSRSLGMWTHVLDVTVSNTHPYEVLVVDTISLVLDDSLQNEHYRISHPIISSTYDIEILNCENFPIELRPSGSFTFAFQLRAKFMSCCERNVTQENIYSTSDIALAYDMSPQSALPLSFSTPLKFKWREKVSMGESESSDFKSQYASILQRYYITSIDYIPWSACIPVRSGSSHEESLKFLTDLEFNSSENKPDSIFIDVCGPGTANILKSFPILVRVTNTTAEEKNMVLKISSGISSIDLM